MSHHARQQRIVLFEGHVQGVGFRATTRQAAEGYGVVGYVRNLPDGRVELVAEGAASEIDELLAEVRKHLGGHIRSEQSDTRPPSGNYDRFDIRY